MSLVRKLKPDRNITGALVPLSMLPIFGFTSLDLWHPRWHTYPGGDDWIVWIILSICVHPYKECVRFSAQCRLCFFNLHVSYGIWNVHKCCGKLYGRPV